MRPSGDTASKRASSMHWVLATAVCTTALASATSAQSLSGLEDAGPPWQSKFFPTNKRIALPAKRGPPSEDWDGKIPLVITNKCDDTIWPGIVTQSGTGPGTGGFELVAGNSTRLWVAPDWQGRVWGRTNCTVDGDSCSCDTGDCLKKLDCDNSVSFRESAMELPSRLTNHDRVMFLRPLPNSH